MANKKLSALTELAETPASGDMVPVVDVSDTTGAATGTTKRVSVDNLISEIAVADMAASAVVLESEGISLNDNDTTLPTSAAVKDYVDTQLTAEDLDFQGDSGGALAIDLDSETLTIAGGTGIDTVGASTTVTASIDSTVATLTGSQTLTNKTLTDCDASTQTAGNDTTKIATTAFVTTAVASSDTLAEVLANGNTTGATDIVVTAGQAITTDTVSETTAAAGVTIDSVLVKDNTVTATTFTGALTGSCSGTAATVTGATQSAITSAANLATVGTIGTGVWQGTAIDGAYVDVEGTEVKSTGESGGTKFLREDGDGTCSWATPSGSGTVTSVATSGTVSGITLTSSPSPIVGSGTVTLGGTLSVEGTEVKSTGETGGTKFLREDGDGTCSWVASGTVTSITPAADTGSGTAITSSGTLTSTGGDGIDTAVSGTTTTFSLDINELTDISGTGDVSGWSAGDTMAIVDSSDSNASKRIKLPAEIGIACSDETTAITTTGDKATLMVPRGMRITEVKANVTVAETSNTVIVNVKYHATDPTSTATIFSDSTNCTIATSAYKNNRVLFTDGAGGSQAYYDVAEDGFIVVSVEATAPTDAKGLKVWLLGYWT